MFLFVNLLVGLFLVYVRFLHAATCVELVFVFVAFVGNLFDLYCVEFPFFLCLCFGGSYSFCKGSQFVYEINLDSLWLYRFFDKRITHTT